MKTDSFDLLLLVAIVAFATSCAVGMCVGASEGVVVGLLVTIVLLEFRKELK